MKRERNRNSAKLLGADEFQAIWCQHREMVRRFISRQLPCLPEEDRQDLEQDIWIAIWRSLPSFSHQAALSTWILGVAKHLLCSWLRGQRRQEEGHLKARFASDCVAPQQWVEDCLDCVVARDVVAQIPRKERLVIILRYFKGLTDQEIADITGLKLGTIKGRIRSGLNHLQAVV